MNRKFDGHYLHGGLEVWDGLDSVAGVRIPQLGCSSVEEILQNMTKYNTNMQASSFLLLSIWQRTTEQQIPWCTVIAIYGGQDYDVVRWRIRWGCGLRRRWPARCGACPGRGGSVGTSPWFAGSGLASPEASPPSGNTHTQIKIHTRTHTETDTHRNIHTQTHTYRNTHTHTSKYTHMHQNTHTQHDDWLSRENIHQKRNGTQTGTDTRMLKFNRQTKLTAVLRSTWTFTSMLHTITRPSSPAEAYLQSGRKVRWARRH